MLQVQFDPGVHSIIGISALPLDASLSPSSLNTSAHAPHQ